MAGWDCWPADNGSGDPIDDLVGKVLFTLGTTDYGLERIGGQVEQNRSRQTMSFIVIKMVIAKQSAACRWRVRRSVLRRS